MDIKELMSEAARIAAGRRRRVTRACATCKREMEGTVRRLYCSAACRLKAARARDPVLEKEARRIAKERNWPINVARMEAFSEQVFKGRELDDSTPLIRTLWESEALQPPSDEQAAQELARREGISIEVARLDVIRERVARGRVFDDSTPLIREVRESDDVL